MPVGSDREDLNFQQTKSETNSIQVLEKIHCDFHANAEDLMTNAAITMMSLSVGSVTLLFIYCISMVLFSSGEESSD
jgi:hypothetical protein